MNTAPAPSRVQSPIPSRVPVHPLLALAAAALFLAGCAPKVIPTGTFSSYSNFDFVNRRDVKMRRGPDVKALDKLNARPGTKAGKTAANPAATSPSAPTTPTLTSEPGLTTEDHPSTRLLVFVIEPVRWTAGSVYTGESRERLQKNARESLLLWTGENYPYPVIYRYGLLQNDPLLYKADVVFIESTITYVHKGFAPARIPVVVLTGLGAVSIQLEGRLHLQSPSGPVIGEFAVRSRTNGVPEGGGSDVTAFFNGFLWAFGLYPKIYSNLYCLKFALIEDGYKLLPHIKDLIPPPPVAGTRS